MTNTANFFQIQDSGRPPYLSQKSSDFDEIWYTTSDIEPGYSHVTKN